MGLNANVRNLPAHKFNEPVKLRTVPFGPPDTRDNTEWNPGRQRFTANNGTSYSTFEGRNFYFLNRGRHLSKKDPWQSGPSVNDLTTDQFVKGAGFWSSPGGTNCDWDNYSGAGNPHKGTGFTVTSKGRQDGNSIFLFDVGHNTQTSSDEASGEYGCVGFSCYMRPDHDEGYNDDQGKGRTSKASVGLRHAYCLYRPDATDEEVDGAKELLEQLLELVSDTGQFLVDEVPDEIQETYVDGKFGDEFEDLDLLRPFLAGGLYEKFEGLNFKNNSQLSPILQMVAELLLNSKGKDVSDYTFIIDDFLKKAEDQGSLDGIDIFDFLVRLCVHEDSFVQENSEYFSLRNVLNPLYDIDRSEIDFHSKEFLINCFLEGGVSRKDDETGEWICSFIGESPELEFVGPTGPFTVSAYESSDEFKKWCESNDGDHVAGTRKECYFDATINPFKEVDYEKGVQTFIDWCEFEGGNATHYEETAARPEGATCEVTYTGNNQLPFRDWCRVEGGTVKSTTNGDECILAGALINMKQSDYDKDTGGFINWCNRNGGDSSYNEPENSAMCSFETGVVDTDYFEGWCDANGGAVQIIRDETTCTFQEYSNFTYSEFIRFPTGFTHWCQGNGGSVAESTTGQKGLSCVIAEDSPMVNFDTWCKNLSGTIKNYTSDNSRYCEVPNVTRKDFSERRYNTNDKEEFRKWCIEYNKGIVQTRTPAPGRSDFYCNISYEIESVYDVKDFCTHNSGRYKANLSTGNDTCSISTLLDYTNAKHHSKGQAGFSAYCKDNNGQLRSTPGSEASSCEIKIDTLETLKNWCRKYEGTFTPTGDYGVNAFEEAYCSIPVTGYALQQSRYKTVGGYIDWCTQASGTVKIGSNNSYVDCTLVDQTNMIGGDIRRTYRYVPGTVTDIEVKYDPSLTVDGSVGLEMTKVVPYEIIDTPAEDIFAHLGLPETNESEYNVYTYKGKGKDTSITDTIVYPYMEVIQQTGRRAYFTQTYDGQPNWGAYAGTIYEDNMVSGNNYEFLNFSPYSIAVWTSDDGGRTWKREGNADSPSTAGNINGYDNSVIILDKGKNAKVRYAANDSASKYKETIEDYKPNGKDIDAQFDLHISGDMSTNRRAYHQDRHNNDVPIWDLYGPVGDALSTPYTDVLELNHIYKIAFKDPASVPANCRIVNVFVSRSGARDTFTYFGSISPEEVVLAPDNTKKYPKPNEPGDYPKLVVESIGAAVLIPTKLAVSWKMADDGGFSGQKYVRYSLSEEISKIQEQYFLPDGIEIPVTLTKESTTDIPSGIKYYWSRARNTKPDFSKYVWFGYATATSIVQQGYDGWIGIEGITNTEIELWGTNVKVAKDSKTPPSSSNFTKIHTFPKNNIGKQDFFWENPSHKYLYFIAPNPSKYKEEDFIPHGRNLKVSVSASPPIGKARSLFAESENKEPDWNFYENVYTVRKTDDENIQITNKSKYKIVIWGADEENWLKGKWTRIDVLKGTGAPEEDRVYEYAGIEYNYFRYVSGDAKTKYHETIDDYIGGWVLVNNPIDDNDITAKNPWGKVVDVTHVLSAKDKPKGRRAYWQLDEQLAPDWESGLYDEPIYSDKLVNTKLYTLKNRSKYTIAVWGALRETSNLLSKIQSIKPNEDFDVRGDQYDQLFYGAADANKKFNESVGDFVPYGKTVELTLEDAPLNEKTKRILYQESATSAPLFNTYEDWNRPTNKYTDKIDVKVEYRFKNSSNIYDVDLWAADEQGHSTGSYEKVGTAYKAGGVQSSEVKFKSTIIKNGVEKNYTYLRYGARNGKDLVEGNAASGHAEYRPNGKEFKGELFGIEMGEEDIMTARAYHEDKPQEEPHWFYYNNEVYELKLTPNFEYTLKNKDAKYDIDVWLLKKSDVGFYSRLVGTMGRTPDSNTVVFDVKSDKFDRLRLGNANSGNMGEDYTEYQDVLGDDGTIRDGKEVAVEQVLMRPTPVRSYHQDNPQKVPSWALYNDVQTFPVPQFDFAGYTQIANFSPYEIVVWGTKSPGTTPADNTFEKVGTCKGYVAGKQDHIYELNSTEGYISVRFGAGDAKSKFNEKIEDGFLPLGKEVRIEFQPVEQVDPDSVRSYWCKDWNSDITYNNYDAPLFSQDTSDRDSFKFMEITNNEEYSVRLNINSKTTNQKWNYFSLLPGQKIILTDRCSLDYEFPETDYSSKTPPSETIANKTIVYQAIDPGVPESDWPRKGKVADIKFEELSTPTVDFYEPTLIYYSSREDSAPSLSQLTCYYISRSNELYDYDYDDAYENNTLNPNREYDKMCLKIDHNNRTELNGDIQIWYSKVRQPRNMNQIKAGDVISPGERFEIDRKEIVDDYGSDYEYVFFTSINGEGFDSKLWDPKGNIFNLDWQSSSKHKTDNPTPGEAEDIGAYYSHHQWKFCLHRDYDNELSRMSRKEGIKVYDLYSAPFNLKSSDQYFTMMLMDASYSLRAWGTNDKTNFTNLTKAYALKYDITGSDYDTTNGFGSIGIVPYGDDNSINDKTYTTIFQNKYRYVIFQIVSPDIHMQTEDKWSAQYPKIPYYYENSLGTGPRKMTPDIEEFYDISGQDQKTSSDITLEEDIEITIKKYDTVRNGIPDLRAYTVVNDANEKLSNLTVGAFTYFKGKKGNETVPNPNFNYSDYQTFWGTKLSVGSRIFENFDILKHKTARVENNFTFPLQIRIMGYVLPTKGGDPYKVDLKRESTPSSGDTERRSYYEFPNQPKIVYEGIVETIPANSSKSINVEKLYDKSKHDKKLVDTTNSLHNGYQNVIVFCPIFVKVQNSGGNLGENFYTINEKNTFGQHGNTIRSENVPHEGFFGDIKVTNTNTDKDFKKCYWSQNAKTVPPVDVWWTDIKKFDLQTLGGDFNEDTFEFTNNATVNTNTYVNRNIAIWWADELPAGQDSDRNIEPDGRTKKHFMKWEHHGDIVRIGQKISIKARARYVLLAQYDYSATLDKQYWQVESGDGLPVDFSIRRLPNKDVQKGTLYLNQNNLINSQPRWTKYNKPLKYERLTAGNTYDFKNLSNYSIQGWITDSISANKVPNGSIRRTAGIPKNTSKRVELKYDYVYWSAYTTGVSSEEEWGLDGRSGDVEVTLVSLGSSGASGASGASGILGSSGSSGIIGSSGSSGILGGSGLDPDVGGPCRLDTDCPAGFECKNGKCRRKGTGSSGIFDKLWDWIGGKPGKPNWKPGKLMKKLFKWLGEVLGPLAAELLAFLAVVLATMKVLSIIGGAIEGAFRALDLVVEANKIEDSNEMKIGGFDTNRDYTSAPGFLPDFIVNFPPTQINPGHPALNNKLEEAIEEIKENLPDDIDLDSIDNPESHPSHFCHWPRLENKFVNLTISKPMQAATRLLRARMNGFMFHFTHTSTKQFDDFALTTRVMRMFNLAPTYGFGYTQMRSNNFRKVVRDYNENRVAEGYHTEKKYQIDTRFDHIRYDKNWTEEDAWFNPVSSLAPNAGHQNPYETKGGAIHYIGKLGADMAGGGVELGSWPNGVISKSEIDIMDGPYFMNVFNDYGAGSKYNCYYDNTASGHGKYKSWTWELMAAEPEPWPLGAGAPGIDFVLRLIDLETDTQTVVKKAFRDWQINYIHLAFEHLVTGQRKSIEVYPQPGSLNYDYYKFRRSWVKKNSDAANHKMDQLSAPGDYMRLQCTPRDTSEANLIDENWGFWGISTSAWIGTVASQARWRSYNFCNLKPMIVPK